MGSLVTALINYDSPTGFSFNSNLIEFVDSKAKLKLQSNPGQIFSQSFSSDSGFTYDNTKAEFVAGVLRQKDQRQSGSFLAATYTSSKDLNWINSGVSGFAETGSTVLNNGKLDCLGYANNGVKYENALIGGMGNVGTVRFKFTPNYSGGPSSQINIFELAPTSGNAGKIVFHHTPSGNTLRMTTYNNLGQIIHTAAQIGGTAWLPTAGQEYEFAIVIDTLVSGIKVYIDGVLKGSPSFFAYDRGTTANRLYIGAGLQYPVANGSYNDVLVYSTLAFTANYAPGYSVSETIYLGSKVDGPNFSYSGVGTVLSVDDGEVTESGLPRYIVGGQYWNGSAWIVSNGSYAQANDFNTSLTNFPSFDTGGGGILPWSIVFTDSNSLSSVDFFSVEVTGQIYPTSNPTILTSTGNGQQDVQDFIEEAVKNGSDQIKYTFFYSGKDYYVSGGILVESNGTYAQSSTAAEIIAALPLNIDPDASVMLRAFLHSQTGQTSPELESVTISYNPYFLPIATGECLVYGHVLDGLVPVNGARVQIETKKPFFRNGNLVSVNEVVTTTPLGYFSVLLPVTGTNTLTVTATWTDSEGKAQKRQYKIIVPDETISINIEEIQSA